MPANQNLQNPMGSREDWTLFRSLNTLPPAEVVAGQLAAGVEDNFRSALMSEFLGSPEFQSRLAGYVESVVLPAHDAIEEALPEWLGENPTDNWLGWVAAEADEIARAAA
jgi:hypothetical protein